MVKTGLANIVEAGKIGFFAKIQLYQDKIVA